MISPWSARALFGGLALALVLPAAPATAAELGRLFYAPAQRSSLDVARAKRARTTVGTEESSAAPAPPTPEVVTYSGMVRRSDGKTTVWVNNRALTGKEAAGEPTIGRIRPDGSLVVQSPQTERSVSLKVGQRAELTSGTIKEGYLRAAPSMPGQSDAEAGPGGKPAAADEKRAAGGVDNPAAGREREAREQQERLDEAIRLMQDAAAARSGNGAAPAPVEAPAAPLQ